MMIMMTMSDDFEWAMNAFAVSSLLFLHLFICFYDFWPFYLFIITIYSFASLPFPRLIPLFGSAGPD